MKIQFNTDQTIPGDEKSATYFDGLIKDGLKRFSSQITRIEVHLSDEDGNKDGSKAIRCLLEARLKGRQPIAVNSQEDTEEQAISSAIVKMKSSIETILAKSQNH